MSSPAITWIFPTLEKFKSEVTANAEAAYLQLLTRFDHQKEEIDLLESQLDEVVRSRDTAQLILENTKEQLKTANEELAKLRDQTPAPPPPPAANSGGRSERMPDPEKFDGSREKLPGFVLQLRTKLSVNADRFANENNMVLYAINRLEGAALEQVRHTVLANGTTTWTDSAELIASLETAFGDPDPTGTARRELYQLRQGKRDFSAYLADFQRIMGRLNYDETAKIDALDRNMSEELKEAVVTIADYPTKFDDLCKILLSLDNRIRARREEKRSNTRNTMGQFSAPAAVTAPAFVPASSFVPGGLAPMDLSFGRTSTFRPAADQRYILVNGRRKLSPKEKTWRQTNNRCLFCAGEGHIFSNCPSASKRPTMRGALTQLCHLELSIQQHQEKAPFFVTKLGHYPLVLGIPWMNLHDVHLQFANKRIEFNSKFCTSHCTPKQTVISAPSIPPPVKINAAFIGAAAFRTLTKKKGIQIYSISLYEINKILDSKTTKEEWRQRIPAEYHAYLDMFDKTKAQNLPPRRPYDHRITLQEGKEPPFGPRYGMSRDELLVLKKYIEDNLSKGFIRASSSSAGSPVLFAAKPDGSLRLCVDYRGLNALTVKDRYTSPLVKETLDRLAKAQWYSKLDLRDGFHQIRIAEGEEWKTAFRTRYGLYEYLVMPFGLTNAPGTFQRFVNDSLREYLDLFCTAYLDDILIYSDTLAEHKVHVKQVLDALKANDILLKPEKCEFHVQNIKYLGLVLTPDGIKMDEDKLKAVRDWNRPKSVKDVQAFLGFANFYRRFILGFSRLASPLTAFTKKGVIFEWTVEAELAFEALKDAFTKAPVLMHFDPRKKIFVESDASDFVSGGVLSQLDDNGVLHPVAFFSKKHSPAECNYEIYDKELLAIIRCFEEWRPELEGSEFPISVITDHKNLEYFMTTKQLNRRQVRWAEYLSRFDFVITYRPGVQGGKPDALTRRSGDLPEEGDERLQHQHQIVLKEKNVDPKLSLLSGSLSNEPAVLDDPLEELMNEGYKADPFPQKILSALKNGEQQSKEITLGDCAEVNHRLLYRQKLYIPDHDPLRLLILQRHHDAPSAGHPGREKTFELVSRHFYWPKMREYIGRYTRNCHTCRRAKPNTLGTHGVLKPLPIPNRPWEELSMDFVTGLPESNGFDAIMVVVDRLSKMRHLIPCNTTINAEKTAELYLQNVWKLHGLPSHVTSDRGTQFTARFWKHLCQRLNITARMSTAFHPETDGQIERLNAVMEQYLRCYVSYQQNDWQEWLPLAEFAANNQESASTKATPFFANYGYHPRFDTSIVTNDRSPQTLDADVFASKMEELRDFLRVQMRTAQDVFESSTNRHRTPAPAFKVKDEVFVSMKNMRTTRSSKKLDWKWSGPFPIKRVISAHAYEIELPLSMKYHPVFHVSLIKGAPCDPLPGQIIPPPPPIQVNDHEEYLVESILDARLHRGKLQYLVEWTGYALPTWEPAEYHEETEAVDIFHRRYPNKPTKDLIAVRRSSRL